jgi:hypothetical protein
MDHSEILRFENGADTRLKPWRLSQAIRAGAKLLPKAKVFPFISGGSCAFGAAYHAIFGHTLPESSGEGEGGFFPYLDVLAACGIDPDSPEACRIVTDVYQRNDGMHGHDEWTREAIADWLDARGL